MSSVPSPRSSVPAARLRAVNPEPPRAGGDWVLYWMIAARRTRWNFGLQRAVDWARELRRPLVILEALRCDYRWASDRLHRFVVDGMQDNAASLARRPVLYHPYVEPAPGAGQGLLAALARKACVVVTDEYPCFFLAPMVEAAGRKLEVLLEAVDSNGLLPLRSAGRLFVMAHSFRSFLQRVLPLHLDAVPVADPLARVRLPRVASLGPIARTWPAARLEGRELQGLPLDHSVAAVAGRGGAQEGSRRLGAFLRERRARYATERNQPEAQATSGLSPYLHFGHVGAHQVLAAMAAEEHWTPAELREAFVDQLVTWRELGFNRCAWSSDYDSYDSLPDWARATLRKHARDRRAHRYTLRQFETARTHDPLWNAAQTQLLREGTIHNYLRMVWGKKVLEWSASPRKALEILIELNNKYALDGRDPNSYTGIFWTLGRYDRPFGPEREIFGTVRYMSSQNTARKLRVRSYIEQYTSGGPWSP